eukprot:CAMPEP_0197443704 /NCGR_PEP_ID=MMETSP1175-20131217/9372_1 /TAXON_ID=1003142 /ORGANISM="Triceratium dubium, Strain CCMP147" /LENGTH=800 /DNA_ID=CAMNT_0042974379 /DNA_START=362 /DNA_END=2764 /DNA_ORIENTATION=+
MKLLGGLSAKKCRSRSHDTQVTTPVQEGLSSHEDSMGSYPPSIHQQEQTCDTESYPPSIHPQEQTCDADDQSSVPPPPPTHPPPPEGDDVAEVVLDETGSGSVIQFASGDAVEMEFSPIDLKILERIEQARMEESVQGDNDARKELIPQPRRRRKAVVCFAVIILFSAIAAAVMLGATLSRSRKSVAVNSSNDVGQPTPFPLPSASPTPSPSELPDRQETEAPITPVATTSLPTSSPTQTNAPDSSPSDPIEPSSHDPSHVPTLSPTLTPTDALNPTTAPSMTDSPTQVPIKNAPTSAPPISYAPSTNTPTFAPTDAPSTITPTVAPTNAPNTNAPTVAPTNVPTDAPSTNAPTSSPTIAPSDQPTTLSPTSQPTKPKKEWFGLTQGILNRIQPPSFPDQDFVLTEFLNNNRRRTESDDVSIYTDIFQNAIETCHAAGGGRVVVPPGTYRTGPIRLRSNVNLHLSEGTVIEFSTNPDDYLPPVFTRSEGIELMNYSPFIYAFGEKNIAITGTGILDGRADDGPWWDWGERQDKSWKRLTRMARDGLGVEDRVFGDGYFIYPQFIQVYSCETVLIEGVTVQNSPMWAIHAVLSKNVIVRGISIQTDGPGDGIVPESCSDVLVEDCLINVGPKGDGISLKSGRNHDGRRINVPSAGIVLRNIRIENADAAVSVGSETSGGVNNIFVEGVRVEEADNAFRVKTNSVRGGTIENIYINDVKVTRAREAAVRASMYYFEGDEGKYTPVVRNFEVHDFDCDEANYALVLAGYKRSPIKNFRFVNFRVNADRDDWLEHVEGFSINND